MQQRGKLLGIRGGIRGMREIRDKKVCRIMRNIESIQNFSKNKIPDIIS